MELPLRTVGCNRAKGYEKPCASHDLMSTGAHSNDSYLLYSRLTPLIQAISLLFKQWILQYIYITCKNIGMLDSKANNYSTLTNNSKAACGACQVSPLTCWTVYMKHRYGGGGPFADG